MIRQRNILSRRGIFATKMQRRIWSASSELNRPRAKLTLCRRILTYLIPCRLLTSHVLPTKKLLEPFPRLQDLFLPLAQCIRRGDLRQFDIALQHGEDVFVKRRIYLTLERCRDIALRNLLRKVFIAGGFDEAKECLLANMIYKVCLLATKQTACTLCTRTRRQSHRSSDSVLRRSSYSRWAWHSVPQEQRLTSLL